MASLAVPFWPISERGSARISLGLALPLFALLAGCVVDSSTPVVVFEPPDDPVHDDDDPTDVGALTDIVKCDDPSAHSAPELSVTPGDGGWDLHRVTLDDPRARCADGSPAVLYVRAHDQADLATAWVLQLQHGGTCADGEACRQSWCGERGQLSPAAMSSRWSPAAIEGVGLFAHPAELPSSLDNELARRNVVLFAACSADDWLGTAGDAVLTDQQDEQSFTVRFQGHSLVKAAIEALESGVTSDDGAVELPPLLDASRVLFAGSDSGGYGVAHHADWLGARLVDRGASLAALIDARFDLDPARISDPAAREAVVEQARAAWYDRTEAVWGGLVDASCAEALGGGIEAWRCSTVNHLLRNHVTTPLFVRSDLGDLAQMQPYLDAGLSPGTYSDVLAESLFDLADAATLGVEAASYQRAPAVIGPSCGEHSALDSTTRFLAPSVSYFGLESSFYDLVIRWLDDAEIEFVEDAGESLCAAG